MLDYAQLLKQLHAVSQQLFRDNSADIHILAQLWQSICTDPLFSTKMRATSSTQWTVPSWQDQLDLAVDIAPIEQYRVVSVDGSQIYPDKHQGTNCFLINTGLVDITYTPDNAHHRVHMSHQPQVFVEEDHKEDSFILSAELVNCRRQEYELRRMLEYGKRIGPNHELPYAFLFDGSLIFWHLETKDVQLKHTFLSCYLMLMHQLYELKIPIAGYISLPKSKELINIVRAALEARIISHAQQDTIDFDHCIDTIIASFILQENQRTIIFKHNSSISVHYPAHLQPHFFYLDVGDEIARVEIPAWIAQDEMHVARVSAIMRDQCKKGRGYPVALAEAHEQAVIKGPDREFFYHLIYKIAHDNKKNVALSQKSIKKRGIGI